MAWVPKPGTDISYPQAMDSSARRDQLIRLLRRRGHTTVQSLAGELSVSRRTVLRDIATLRSRGFVIRSEGGPGGGVELDPDTVYVSSQLKADEVVALALSVAMLRAAPWMPFADLAERALGKIEGALPPRRTRELRRLLARVFVGDPALGGGFPEPVEDALLGVFERAFTQGYVLTFDYVDRHGACSSRWVEPHGLLVRAPYWYLLCWDRERDAVRTFRMDRVARPALLEGERFTPRSLQLLLEDCPDARPSRSRGARRDWPLRSELSKLRNLGPKTTAWLNDVGIETPDHLRECGAAAAYVAIKQAFPERVNRNALWALFGALEDVSWDRVRSRDKRRLEAEIEELLTS